MKKLTSEEVERLCTAVNWNIREVPHEHWNKIPGIKRSEKIVALRDSISITNPQIENGIHSIAGIDVSTSERNSRKRESEENTYYYVIQQINGQYRLYLIGPFTMDLDLKVKVYFRDQFRKARDAALRDAEGFQEVLFALEKFGAYLTKDIENKRNPGLGSYTYPIWKKALDSPLAEDIPERCQSWHVRFSKLYDLVREARNDALHQGALARHLTNSAIQLALVLEDALMRDCEMAGDYMVREPVCASLWQPLSFIRQQMLAHSFTYLPVLRTDKQPLCWFLVSDYLIAQYLRKGERKKRKERLAKTLEDAVNDGLDLGKPAETCCCNTPVSKVLKKCKGKPVLVVEKGKPERLLSILTPFDLL